MQGEEKEKALILRATKHYSSVSVISTMIYTTNGFLLNILHRTRVSQLVQPTHFKFEALSVWVTEWHSFSTHFRETSAQKNWFKFWICCPEEHIFLNHSQGLRFLACEQSMSLTTWRNIYPTM